MQGAFLNGEFESRVGWLFKGFLNRNSGMKTQSSTKIKPKTCKYKAVMQGIRLQISPMFLELKSTY